ncbi:hypothetical protein BD779DRAFT_497640 [Infundibulicybe gibba]|nr:hypothetical protein BD779DRAFT_497640 [Infundibulicybe gibba]
MCALIVIHIKPSAKPWMRGPPVARWAHNKIRGYTRINGRVFRCRTAVVLLPLQFRLRPLHCLAMHKNIVRHGGMSQSPIFPRPREAGTETPKYGFESVIQRDTEALKESMRVVEQLHTFGRAVERLEDARRISQTCALMRNCTKQFKPIHIDATHTPADFLPISIDIGLSCHITEGLSLARVFKTSNPLWRRMGPGCNKRPRLADTGCKDEFIGKDRRYTRGNFEG